MPAPPPSTTSSPATAPTEIVLRPAPGLARGLVEGRAYQLWALAVVAVLVGVLVFVRRRRLGREKKR